MEPHDRYDSIDETVLAKDIEMGLQQTFNYEESSKREKDSNYDHEWYIYMKHLIYIVSFFIFFL